MNSTTQGQSPSDTPPAAPATAWGRLHAALMPDYNPRATAYWWTMVLIGSAALALAFWDIQHLPLTAVSQVVVGTAFAIVAGFFPVRIPRSKNSFVAGEVFIFLLLLMHGTSAASIASAGEAFVGACRSSRRWTSRIASPTMAALAMTVAGHLMEWAFAMLQLDRVANPGMLLLVACLVAVGYFVLNTLMVSTVITLKTDRRFRVGEFVASFGSIGIAYGGSALIAVLLHMTVQHSGLGVLMACAARGGHAAGDGALLPAASRKPTRRCSAAAPRPPSARPPRPRATCAELERQRATLPQRLHPCVDRHGAGVDRRTGAAGQQCAGIDPGPRRGQGAAPRPRLRRPVRGIRSR
jgi:hypothetical protein